MTENIEDKEDRNREGKKKKKKNQSKREGLSCSLLWAFGAQANLDPLRSHIEHSSELSTQGVLGEAFIQLLSPLVKHSMRNVNSPGEAALDLGEDTEGLRARSKSCVMPWGMGVGGARPQLKIWLGRFKVRHKSSEEG